MGKTIQMISLLVTRRDIKPNLILCPTVAMLQWFSELKERTTEGCLSVLIYHGINCMLYILFAER
jgi:DNA repair protein RAD16